MNALLYLPEHWEPEWQGALEFWSKEMTVFVDVLEDTWCLDPAKVGATITPMTKAIMAVHLYGSIADMDTLLDIGRRRGVPVIEDAGESMGSRWRSALGRWALNRPSRFTARRQ